MRGKALGFQCVSRYLGSPRLMRVLLQNHPHPEERACSRLEGWAACSEYAAHASRRAFGPPQHEGVRRRLSVVAKSAIVSGFLVRAIGQSVENSHLDQLVCADSDAGKLVRHFESERPAVRSTADNFNPGFPRLIMPLAGRHPLMTSCAYFSGRLAAMHKKRSSACA